MVRVETRSGTVYEIDPQERTVRRVNIGSEGAFRRDGEAITYTAMTEVNVGQRIGMLLDLRGDGVTTVRVTTPVVSIA